MSSVFVRKGEAEIVRALIIARGRDGATLEDIKKDFLMEEGEELDFQNDRSLRLWLEQVDHIKVKERNGDAVYFSEAPEQLHLVKMIRRQKTNTKIFTNSKRSSNFSHPRNRQSSVTPKTSLKSLAFRRQQFNSTAKVASPPMGDKSSKMFGTSNPMFLHSSLLQTPNRPCPIPPECDVHATNKKFRSCFFGRADERDGNINHDLSCSSENLSNHSEDLNDQVDPLVPEFFKCILVGDNFFLNLAVMDLGFRMVKRDRILQSGYCVSGQTIAEATRSIASMSPNQIILVNVGNVDLVYGKELVEMIYEMMRLMRMCALKEVTPILTTLLPLANCRLGNRPDVMNAFNEFLMRNPYEFPVIELHKTFATSQGVMDPVFYQQAPRFVSGMSKPLVFWSRMGRQRVMRSITQQLGSAILKILIR